MRHITNFKDKCEMPRWQLFFSNRRLRKRCQLQVAIVSGVIFISWATSVASVSLTPKCNDPDRSEVWYPRLITTWSSKHHPTELQFRSRLNSPMNFYCVRWTWSVVNLQPKSWWWGCLSCTSKQWNTSIFVEILGNGILLLNFII